MSESFKIEIRKRVLQFKQAAGTSRGTLLVKPVWYVILKNGQKTGIGECNPLAGLSIDDRPDFDQVVRNFASQFESQQKIDFEKLEAFPSIKMGFEMALIDFNQNETCLLFPSDFTDGKDSIPINGLIWMGDHDHMLKQIHTKIEEGYGVLKLKIGAINFSEELDLLQTIRSAFDARQMELRVDANGAFSVKDALNKLTQLAKFDIHSIEQPIAAGQWKSMAEICINSPIPVALDEELIGLASSSNKKRLLDVIQPQYIILKPSLLGGFNSSSEWIEHANSAAIKWWVTSALESNIGLNAIAQYTYQLGVKMPQGLGTGMLYTNNIASPLYIKNGALYHTQNAPWSLNEILDYDS